MDSVEIGVWLPSSTTGKPILVPRWLWEHACQVASAAEKLNIARTVLRKKCEEAAGTSLSNFSTNDLVHWVDLGIQSRKASK